VVSDATSPPHIRHPRPSFPRASTRRPLPTPCAAIIHAHAHAWEVSLARLLPHAKLCFSLPSLRAHNCQRTSFSMSFARQEILVGVADTVGSAILGLCIFYIGWSRHRSWLRSGGAIVGGLRDTYRV
jgi:hypothetical protein